MRMLNMYSDSTIPTSRFTATSELLALQEDSSTASREVYFGQWVRTIPSNGCSTSPQLSESLIENTTEFALSGLGISFGKTLPYLTHKTVTRRSWKDSHAQKFINAFEQNKLIKALDKDIRYGGKRIGWCRLLCAPYKEQLAAMPYEDLQAEGGMCSSVPEFIQRYFKGNSSQEIWVIRFEFVELDRLAQTPPSEALGVYSDSETKADSNSDITLLTESIHQAQLAPVLVSLDSHSFTNSNLSITSLAESIHQSSTPSLGVYQSDGNQSDSNATNDSLAESIHQAPTVQGGSGLVYSFWKGESIVNHYRYKVKADGKWQVKSIHIPVGKLPKVREAITNKLGVAAIVTEVLGKQL